MKINTISAYLLVYLLARSHWNLMVPVRAEEESDVSTGSATADAGSATNGAAEATPLTGSAAPEASSSETYAGLTSADGSANGAGADADASAGLPADGTSTGDASADPSLTVSTGADGSVASSENGSGTDADAGSSEGGEANAAEAELLAKKEAAKRLAENARKAAEELIKKADALDKVIEETGNLEEFNDKVEALVYNIRVDASHINSAVNPLDMSYYSGFPNGWHFKDPGALQDLEDREKKLTENLMYYAGFPDGWHFKDPGALQDLEEREKKLTENFMYYAGFPDGWHKRADHGLLREFRRHELKGEIAAKKKEIESLNNVILDLTTQMQAIEAEVVKLEQEHNDLVQKLLGFDALLIKLYKADADGNSVLMEENTDFEKKKAHGDLRFEFKDGVICTEVKFGAAHVWKKAERDVDVPKLVAFNDTVGVLAVRDENRAVLYKKDTNSDKWNYHNTVTRQTRTGVTTRTAAHTGSSPGSTLASSSALAGSKMNLEAGSTGTPETPESLDETASVASGEGSESNEANEADSGTALRGSTEGSAGLASEGSTDGGSSAGGSSGQGISSGDYSSVFMD